MNAFFNPYMSGRLCLTLLHSLWQVALFVLAVWMIERLWRKQSVERSYGLCVAVIILSLAALPLTFAVIQIPEPTAVAVNHTAVSQGGHLGHAVAPGLPTPSSPRVAPDTKDLLLQPPTSTMGFAIQETAEQDWAAIWLRFAPWFAGMYAGGVALMLIRLSAGIIRAERLRCLAESIAAGPLVESLQTLSRRWSMRVVPVLAQANHIVVPKVVGLLKPTILLPASALSGLSTAELEMILAHELAHVRRYDMWVTLLQRLSEVVLFFNPALWFLSRRIGLLREYCCDELACRELSASNRESRMCYAEALLRVVELAKPDKSKRSELAALAASGRSPSELRRRLARLIGEPLCEPIRLPRAGLLVLISLMLSLPFVPHIAESQSNPLQEEETDAAQIIEFPQNRTVGVLQSRPADSGGYGYGVDLYGGWQRVGPARGAVTISSDHHVRLDVSKVASADLSFMDDIDPDAIQFLNLEGTDVNDEQLRHVGKLAGLRMLRLERTRITDSGIQHLVNLKKVKHLHLSAFGVHRNGFGVGDGAMAVVAQFPALERIALRLTKVTDAGMEELAKCKSLKSIGIEGTAVTDNGLKYLLDLPNLYSLQLGAYDEGANVTDKGMRTVGQMIQLNDLDLSGTPVTNEGIAHLSGLSDLESLSIDNTNITEAGLVHLAPLKNLARLRLFDTVTDAGAKHLSRLTSLKSISANLDLSDKGVTELAKLPHLEQLMLSDDRITDVSLQHIARMPALKTLWFQDCSVSDEGLELLRGSPTIEYLLIRNTQVTTAGLAHLQTLPNLRILCLGITSPEGEQTGWSRIKNFTQIERLRLHGAGFSNEDFVYLEELVQLTELDLELSEPINDDALAYLDGLIGLTQLEFENTIVTDKGLSALSGMEKLEYLTISCLATDEGLQSLQGLKSLRNLQIASPYVTDAGLAALTEAMPSLQKLNHFDYRLNGSRVTPSKKDAFWRRGTPDERPVKDVLEDKPAPELFVGNLINTDAADLNLASLRGKVVLVDFWGTWCGPCRAMLPELKALYEKHHADGLEIIGVHSTSHSDDVAEFVKEQALPWPIAVDAEKQTVSAWQVHRYPSYYLIDRSGNLRIADIFKGQLEPAIEQLLVEGHAESSR